MVCAHVLPVPARILTWLWSHFQVGQTSARNRFSTLKIGGYHVCSPWDQLFSALRPPGRFPRKLPAPVCVGSHGTQAHPVATGWQPISCVVAVLRAECWLSTQGSDWQPGGPTTIICAGVAEGKRSESRGWDAGLSEQKLGAAGCTVVNLTGGTRPRGQWGHPSQKARTSRTRP